MSTFQLKNGLRTIIIEAQIVQKLKNNEARPKFTGSYKKKRVIPVSNTMIPHRRKFCFVTDFKERNQTVCDFVWNRDTAAISWKITTVISGLWLPAIMFRDEKLLLLKPSEVEKNINITEAAIQKQQTNKTFCGPVKKVNLYLIFLKQAHLLRCVVTSQAVLTSSSEFQQLEPLSSHSYVSKWAVNVLKN